MKKRVLSMLLAFILCFSTLPMTAFAQEALQEADAVTEQEEQQEAAPAAEQEEQQQEEAEAAAALGEETPADKSTTAATPGTEDSTAGEAPDTVEPTAESVSDSDAGTQDTVADDEKKAAVQKVQALIDALPETVTVENAESVSAQLAAIDEAMESLTEEQIAELDMEHLYAISEALNAPMTVAEGEHTHFLCGKDTCNGVGGHTETDKVTFTAWKETSTLPETAGNYYLMYNVTLKEAWTPRGVVVLCLNGHNITLADNNNCIIPQEQSTVTLCDCEDKGQITHRNGYRGSGARVADRSTFNMYGGSITGNTAGAGVSMYNGTFNMYGGSITGNTANTGAGVSMHNGTFNMYGGSITGNEAKNSTSNSANVGIGGGVYMEQNSTFNMYDGTISNNTGEYGGGVYIHSKSVFNMSGGTIENNQATGNNTAFGGGGGVNIAGDTFNMSGGTIKDNTTNAYGGGVCVCSNFNMTGGEIADNKAKQFGDGVYVNVIGNMGHFTVSGSAKVSDNTTSNVYLPDGATMAIGQGGFDNTASIGVTTKTSPAQGSYVAIATGAANGGYRDGTFINDQITGDCKFQQVGDQILLVNGTLHQHPICGKTCDHGDEHTDEAWKGVSSLSEITTGGNYYLTQDIEQTQTWNLPNDKVVLCLNGHNITANANVDVIKTSSYAQFILTDCRGEKTEYGKITHKEGRVGRGIYVNNIFTMYGGEISGNDAPSTSNKGYGGGVYVYDGCSFTMNGGKITSNTAGFCGGGVYLSRKSNFTMNGGSITGNSAQMSGGGVELYGGNSGDDSTFTVSGKAVINGNITKGSSTKANNVACNGTIINVASPGLDSEARIGVSTSEISEGDYKVVAQGKSSYQMKDTDAERFHSDNGYASKLIGNSIVFMNGTLHEHAVCGKTDCTEAGHDNTLWIPLTYDSENQILQYGGKSLEKPTYNNKYTLPAGNYYLFDDITLDGSIAISGDVNICLNGHTISTKLYNSVFDISSYKLAVCDCSTGHSGKIEIIDNHSKTKSSIVVGLNAAQLCLYGGTIQGGDYGVYSNNSSVKLFGGSITGNTIGVDGSAYDSLTIGGDAKVIDNTTKNLKLFGESVIRIDKSLTSNAKIGITIAAKPSANANIKIATGATNSELDYAQIFIPDTSDQKYVVTKDKDGNLYMGLHQHNWQVTAECAQITFKCSADGCKLESDFATTYTVTAPTDLTYSGSEKVATVTTDDKYSDGLGLPTIPAITYQKYNGTAYISIEGVPKDAGTYRAILEITNSDNTTATATLDYAITKAPLTVTAKDKEIIYGDNPANDGVVYSGFVNGEDEKVLGGTLGYTYSYKQYDNVGDAYIITPTGLTSDNYEINYDLGKLKVTPLEAKLEWENTANRTYGDGKGNVTAKITNLVNNDAINVTVSGGNTLTAGTHTATATGLTGDKADNYTLPASATREYTIGSMAQNLTFATSGNVTKTYGDGAFANAATNDRADGSEVTYSSSDTSVAEVDAYGNVTIKGAGTATITASAVAVEGKYSEGTAKYTLKVDKKTLTVAELEFTTNSTFTKVYTGNSDCATAKVQIKDSAKVNPDDIVPDVTGIYAYNSPNVKDACKVTFTSKETKTSNYILPEGLIVEQHNASITKANQDPITITSTSATYGTDLTLTVDGGSGNGALTYTVENGTGAATIIDGILHPVKVGEVTVQATKSGDDNYYDVQSARTTITIAKGTYPGTVSMTVNIMRNRSDVQKGSLYAEDFFPKGQVPEYAQITIPRTDSGEIVTVKQLIHSSEGYILGYTSAVNITSTTDQTCKVTISSDNYNDITATLTFHPTDKTTVTIDGLTYTNKTYDGSAIQPTGTLQVTGGNVPANELEVKYESIGNTTYSSTNAPTNAGTYKVTYKVADSNENYTGEVTYNFTISPKNVTAGMIGTIAAQKYTGSAITPEPVVKDGEVTLVSGTDFDFSYDKNINADENTATLTITGKGNYTGTASQTFTIKPKDIQGAVIKLQADSLGYTGLMQEVKITSVTLGQVTLTANDYDIVKGSNKQINADDSITLTIAGKGNYTGMATTTWKITKATPELGNFDVTPELSQKQTYDGKSKEVTAKTKNGVIDMGDVTVCYEGISGTTYTRSETAPTNAGIYKVILSVAEGKNYTAAEIEAGTLTIDKADLTVEDVTEFFEYTKTGTQTINVANLVPGARSYALDAYADDNGILTGDITIDATGLMKFALSALTKYNIDNKVTVPVTITSENYKDVTVKVTIYISPEYRIIEGANSSWTQNTDGTVVIRGNGEFSRFHAVKVDGKVIDRANYDAKEGSTIITLKAEYLKTLATGSHTFAIVWDNGIAGTNFAVVANTPANNGNNNSSSGSDQGGSNDSSDNTNTSIASATGTNPAQEMDKVPATGDPFGIWLTLFGISLTGLAGMLARRKKN